jgi:hypothetical protein
VFLRPGADRMGRLCQAASADAPAVTRTSRAGRRGRLDDSFDRWTDWTGQVAKVPWDVMPYALEPLVAGELGPDTVLDRSCHPPRVERMQFLLDEPATADLVESFPVYLVSEALAAHLEAAELNGVRFDAVEVRPTDLYSDRFGEVPHKAYRWMRLDPPSGDADAWIGEDLRLCVSDHMMELVERGDLSGCEIEPLE